MVHLSGTVVAVLGWAVTLAATAIAFILSGRAGRLQARAATASVDAGAYDRARGIYESAIAQLQRDNDALRRHLDEKEAEADRLRDLARALNEANRELRSRLPGENSTGQAAPGGS